MKDDKLNFITKAFLDNLVFLSTDCYCDPINLYFSIPIWKNKDTEDLDKILIL